LGSSSHSLLDDVSFWLSCQYLYFLCLLLFVPSYFSRTDIFFLCSSLTAHDQRACSHWIPIHWVPWICQQDWR
jgi:hypothetical protein